MITIIEAEKIAKKYLLEKEREFDESLQLIDSETIEKSIGWVFFYNSKEYIETGDFLSMLAGNAPFIINRNNGELYETGTAMSLDEYVSEYEAQLSHSS